MYNFKPTFDICNLMLVPNTIKHCIIQVYIRKHGSLWQYFNPTSSTANVPSIFLHFTPPYFGAGLEHWRVLYLVPLSHVFKQPDQLLHCDQLPFTITKKSSLGYCKFSISQL